MSVKNTKPIFIVIRSLTTQVVSLSKPNQMAIQLHTSTMTTCSVAIVIRSTRTEIIVLIVVRTDGVGVAVMCTQSAGSVKVCWNGKDSMLYFKQCKGIFTARIRRMGLVMFLHVSVRSQVGGTSWSLVPDPFLGV